MFGVLLLGDVTLHPVAISLTGFQKYDAGVDPASLTTGPLFVILVSEPVPSVAPQAIAAGGCRLRSSFELYNGKRSMSIKRTLL